MTLTWWDLPGTSRWVGSIADALRSGRNVVLRVPELLQHGLGAAVRLATENEHLEWVPFTPAPTRQPTDDLFERFASAAPPSEIRDARNLVTYPGFRGLLIWVEPVRPGDWPAWAEFLAEYEPVCRSLDPLDRTVFCVVSRGEATRHTLDSEVCLESISYQGAIRKEDVHLYVSTLLEERSLKGVERELTCRLILQLAMWDVEAAHRLIHADLASLLDPITVLKKIADERRWSRLEGADWESLWILGAAEKFDGEWKKHSSLFTFSDRERELERRIWTAQVEVLFPWIENQRRRLLEQFGSLLPMPFATREGRVISDIRDLEVGHLQHLLYQLPRTPPRETMDLVWTLKRIRNALSHLEPVSADVLLAHLDR